MGEGMRRAFEVSLFGGNHGQTTGVGESLDSNLDEPARNHPIDRLEQPKSLPASFMRDLRSSTGFEYSAELFPLWIAAFFWAVIIGALIISPFWDS